jgi:hypothetical protein
MAMLPTFVPFVDNDALIDESLKKLKLDRGSLQPDSRISSGVRTTSTCALQSPLAFLN